MPQEKDQGNLFGKTLGWISDRLSSLGIDYMISGGSAVGFWGEVRTTMDIDIVVQLTSKNLSKFIEKIGSEVYLDEDEARKAVLRNGMFNIILNETSFKVDLIVLNDGDIYEREKFSRKIKLNFLGKEIFIISPEDLIISKLRWGKSIGGSERQIRDCESLLRINAENLDKKYLDKWIKFLGLEAEFAKLAAVF